MSGHAWASKLGSRVEIQVPVAVNRMGGGGENVFVWSGKNVLVDERTDLGRERKQVMGGRAFGRHWKEQRGGFSMQIRGRKRLVIVEGHRPISNHHLELSHASKDLAVG